MTLCNDLPLGEVIGGEVYNAGNEIRKVHYRRHGSDNWLEIKTPLFYVSVQEYKSRIRYKIPKEYQPCVHIEIVEYTAMRSIRIYSDTLYCAMSEKVLVDINQIIVSEIYRHFHIRIEIEDWIEAYLPCQSTNEINKNDIRLMECIKYDSTRVTINTETNTIGSLLELDIDVVKTWSCIYGEADINLIRNALENPSEKLMTMKVSEFYGLIHFAWRSPDFKERILRAL